ncbi:S1 family peptidase [Psychrobacillus sp. FSL H8-0487]|uniref:S1 family peptidase n=1 Tax=Psychrobacillus sp. FSL H8-0487 TaxID=2921391 RepID=UPI0030FC4933
MKNLFSTLLITMFFFLFAVGTVNANGKMAEPDFEEKLMEESKNQQQILGSIMNLYEQEGLSLEQIQQDGYIYFSEDGTEIIIQRDINLKNTEIGKKVDKAVAKSLNLKSSGIKVKVEYVEKNYKELAEIQDELHNQLNALGVVANSSLLIEEAKIEVITEKITDEQKKLLINRFGKNIKFKKEHKNITEFSKKRWENWNQLGAGLAIEVGNKNYCSTAGVAKKDSRYFLITAGHCYNGGLVYQYNALVGTSTHDFRDAGYDLGLVTIDLNTYTGGRTATNGFYQNPLSSDAAYDKKLVGQSSLYPLNSVACKTGATTGYTCGKVATARYIDKEFGIVIEVKKDPNQGWMSGQGDSGGAVINSNYQLIGVVVGGYTDGTITSPVNLTKVTVSNSVFFTPWVEAASKYGLTLYTSNTGYKIIN